MRRLWAILTALCCALTTAGCWNYKDLEDFAIVAGCAVDRGNGVKYDLTVEILDMGGQDGQAEPVVCTSSGDTVFEAVRNMGEMIPQKLYWSNCQVLIVGESLAREEISPLLDYFSRDHETRPTLQLLVARDATGREMLETTKGRTPLSFELGKLLENNAKVLATAPQTRLYQAMNTLGATGQALVLPVLTLTDLGEDQAVSAYGGALLNDGRLAGYLDARQSRGWLLATNRAKGGIVTWNLGGKRGQGITLELLQSEGRITATEDDPLFFTVQVTAVASLADSEMGFNLLDELQRELLQQEAAAELEKEIFDAFEAGRAVGCDLFGLGELLSKRAPEHWRALQREWGTYLQSVTLEVKAQVKLQSGGAVKDSARAI